MSKKAAGRLERVFDEKAPGADERWNTEEFGNPNVEIRRPPPAPVDPEELRLAQMQQQFLKSLNSDLRAPTGLPTLAERIATEGYEAQLGLKPGAIAIKRPVPAVAVKQKSAPTLAVRNARLQRKRAAAKKSKSRA